MEEFNLKAFIETFNPAALTSPREAAIYELGYRDAITATKQQEKARKLLTRLQEPDNGN